MKGPFSLFALAAVALAQDEGSAVLTAIQIQSDLTQLFAALQLFPDVVSTLRSASNITIFAPTDTAFAALGSDAPTGDALAAVLNYHVVQGQYPASTIPTMPTYVQTLLTPELSQTDTALTNVTGGQYVGVVNNGTGVQLLSGNLAVSNVVEADIIQGGSISIHKIDRVLTLPENLAITLSEVAGASTIVDAAIVADLSETLTTVEDLTIFVPNDAAFEAIGSVLATANLETLQSVLQYHAITGAVFFAEDVTNTTSPSLAGNLTLSVIDGAVFVNEAKVIIPNIILSNGVAHVIDSVLNPLATEPFDRASLSPSNSPVVAFQGASPTAVSLGLPRPAPTTTLSVPAVLTSGLATVTGTRASASGSATNSGPAVASASGESGASSQRIVGGLHAAGGLLGVVALLA
ncbi:uncharacterized protein AB675_10289 [Cyphellophora attinorum]|uniref:FAS1 domain-containing protein n=1 Tax=Cyphellophora attinorum TaxID=1664694 RepID=A0A0N1H5Z2_9EURO|nr:uncharacterized protein AB675_10289 [Phialophora attinorum]KPI37347.1 hypothetical protein AB675_10289 [Phialophora attinorum]